MADELLSPQQVAGLLNVHVRTAQELFRSQEFPVIDLGHRIKRVRRDDFDAYLERKTKECN